MAGWIKFLIQKMQLFVFGNCDNYLRRLLSTHHRIVGVMAIEVGPDRERFLGPMLTSARQAKIPVWGPDDLFTPDFAVFLKSQQIDIAVSKGFQYRIPENIFSIPQLGTINIHESLLPKYRSRHPINWAIINGEKATGLTIHKVDDGFDTGPILSQSGPVLIGPDDDFYSVYKKLNKAGERLLLDALELLENGKASFVAQKNEDSSYFPQRRPEDGEIHWKKPAASIHNLIRALVLPCPGGYTKVNGRKWIIWETALEHAASKAKNAVPGEIIERHPSKGALVQTGRMGLWICKVQCENSNIRMAYEVEDFKHGMVLGG